MLKKVLVILVLVMGLVGYTLNKKLIHDSFSKKQDPVIRIGWKMPHCSAFVISEDTAVTALHCVFNPVAAAFGQNPPTVNIYNQDGSVAKIARVVLPFRGGGNVDIAKIKGDFSSYKSLNYTPGKLDLTLTDKYVSCGYPYGTKHKYCMPIDPKENLFHMFKSRGYITYGFSGGPTINVSKNTVVGVNTAIMDGYVIFTPLLGIDGLFEE